MKKILLGLFLLLVPVVMMGCQKSVSLEESISEITKIYFVAENSEVKANISVGEREEDYIVDGNHTKNVDFSLIALKFESLLPDNQIQVDLIVNDVNSTIILDLNPANHYYMTDLGYALKQDDKISLLYQDFNLTFENASQTFGVSYRQALSIAKDALGDKLDKYYIGKDFSGEGYLKVLTGQGEEEGDLFWVLTLVGKNGSENNVVLSVVDGKVIISD